MNLIRGKRRDLGSPEHGEVFCFKAGELACCQCRNLVRGKSLGLGRGQCHNLIGGKAGMNLIRGKRRDLPGGQHDKVPGFQRGKLSSG